MKERLAVIALLVLALALRIGFVSQMPLGAPFWDDVHYHAWAETYAEFWRSLVGAEQEPPAPTFREAFEKTLQKGEAYAAGVGLIYAATGGSRRAVHHVQAILDTLSCLLLFGIARALGGRAVGIVALVLAATYEPFFFTAGRLQTESVSMVLLLAGLWAAVAAPRRGATAWHLVGGLATALAMLTKPALQLLLPVFLGAVVLRHRECPWRDIARPVAVFLVGFALLIGPRLVWTQVAFGEGSWTGSSSPGNHVYGGAVIANHGWKTDRQSFANPPRGELLAVLGDPPRRSATDADQWRAAWRTWLLHPVGSAGVMLHKLYVAWALPYNDARHEFLAGRGTQQRIHRVLMILGLFGVPLALRNPRAGPPLIVVTLYMWATYLIVAIEVRYAIVAVPLMLCFGAIALVAALRGIARVRRALVLPGTALSVTVISLLLLPLERLAAWLAPDPARGLRFALTLAAVALGGALFATLLEGSRARRAVNVGLPVLLVVAVHALGASKAHVWREWESPLSNRTSVRHETVLPSELGAPGAAELRIDLLPGPAADCDLILRLNGARVFEGAVERNAMRVREYTPFAQAQGRDRESARTWYRFAVPPALLVPGRPVRIELAVRPRAAAECLTVFGDYPGPAGQFDGPSVLSPDRMADRSVYRYLATGDFRMRRRTPLWAPGRSSFFDGERWSDSDLSLAPGRQLGRYRIFMVLSYPGRVAVL